MSRAHPESNRIWLGLPPSAGEGGPKGRMGVMGLVAFVAPPSGATRHLPPQTGEGMTLGLCDCPAFTRRLR
jgi:hypothetical protein